MSRLMFTRPARRAFAESLAQQFRDEFDIYVSVREIVSAGIVNVDVINTVATRHGPMHLSAQVSKTMANVNRRFTDKPAGPLPCGPTFNEFTFKWNDFTCPDYAPTPADALETFRVNIQAQHAAIQVPKVAP